MDKAKWDSIENGRQGGVGWRVLDGGKWRQLYLNNNKKRKKRTQRQEYEEQGFQLLTSFSLGNSNISLGNSSISLATLQQAEHRGESLAQKSRV